MEREDVAAPDRAEAADEVPASAVRCDVGLDECAGGREDREVTGCAGGKVSGNGWLVEGDGLEEGRDVRWRARERTDGRADRARMRMDCIVVVKSKGVSYYVKM